MKTKTESTINHTEQIKMPHLETVPFGYGAIILNKNKVIEILDETMNAKSIAILKSKVAELKRVLTNPRSDTIGIMNIDANGETLSLRKDILLSDIDQILGARSIERALYYLRRLRAGISEIKTGKINDINLLRWKEYDDIITDSLWILSKRDSSGAHVAEYWGNFIPQIPHQMMLRYTKKGDWVLDTFVGSGTTLIECRRLGRNGIGIELNANVAQRARELVEKETNNENVITDVVIGDSRTIDMRAILGQHKIERVQLLIMHPPYHDIIKFSDDSRDLSNAESIEKFLRMFGEVVDNATPCLERGRYFALVIGDKYSRGEWIPLGFLCMSEVLKRGYLLKAIIVKNFEETRGKRNQRELWRYRALVGGFYVFKHEYVMVFKKKITK